MNIIDFFSFEENKPNETKQDSQSKQKAEMVHDLKKNTRRSIMATTMLLVIFRRVAHIIRHNKIEQNSIEHNQ